jgi:hypothetical protein
MAQVADYVDTGNPAVGIDCPRCGLLTARFGWFCRNCGFRLWPSAETAARAYRTWRLADPARSRIHQWDDVPPIDDGDQILVVDFEERAHELGIHIFPPSRWPFLVCVGILFLGFAAIPFDPIVRIILAAVGVLFFLFALAGWMREDVRIFPKDEPGDDAHGSHGSGH